MEDPFSSSKSSIEHAKRRAAELEIQLAAFRDTKPYAAVVEQNRDRTKDVYKIKLVKPMPSELGHIASEAINALRSALDQAGYACAIGSGVPDGENIKAAFPFRDDPRDFNGARRGTSKNVPEKIFDLMVSFKPYKGGDNLLWGLNKLCNTNKHRFVSAHAMTVGKMHVKKLAFSNPVGGHAWPPTWDSRKNEMVWLTTKRGSAVDMDVDFTGFIVFHQIEGVPTLPIDTALSQLIDLTERIVLAIEAEYMRLGFSIPD